MKAQLIEWPLPLSINLGLYLRHLTQERKGKIYYNKYIVDTIGELDIDGGTVKEWHVPWSLRPMGCNPEYITAGPDGTPWFTLPNINCIGSLDPLTGIFTSITVAGYARQLKFDIAGNVWYIGFGRNTPILGKLNPQTLTGGYWKLPAAHIWDPDGLWIDLAGTIWMTNVNYNMGSTGAAFARFIPSTSELTCWTLPPGIEPSYHGIVADQKAENVWFTRQFTYSGPGMLFRFHTPSNTCFEYLRSNPAMDPWFMVIDSRDNPWFVDVSGKISTVLQVAECQKSIEIETNTSRLERIRARVNKTQEKTKPRTSQTKPREAVIAADDQCYTEFVLPSGKTSPAGAIAITKRKSYPDKIYFTQWGRTENSIGLLILH